MVGAFGDAHAVDEPAGYLRLGGEGQHSQERSDDCPEHRRFINRNCWRVTRCCGPARDLLIVVSVESV